MTRVTELGGLAVLVSFVALGALWRTPRLRGAVDFLARVARGLDHNIQCWMHGVSLKNPTGSQYMLVRLSRLWNRAF